MLNRVIISTIYLSQDDWMIFKILGSNESHTLPNGIVENLI
jgi:hypothetical protein